MKLRMFSIYDCKSEVYGLPWCAPTPASAIRHFSDMTKDSRSEVSRHPADFTLFEIGLWDDNKAELTPRGSLLNLGVALEFVPKDEKLDVK